MKRTLISIFFIALAVAPCEGQWKNEGAGPYQIIAFGVHDSTLFLSIAGHLYRYPVGDEADSGIDFSQGNITTFASAGSNFFAGSGPPNQGAGYRSTNNGLSWQDVIGGPVGTNGTYIFAQYGTRIARSRDGGKTWEHLSYPAGNSYAGTGAVVYTNTPNNGLWRSLDSGGTWSQFVAPFNGAIMTMGPLLFVEYGYDREHVGSYADNGKVIVSTDSGESWDTVHVDSAGTPEYVSSLATDGKNLFAGGLNTNTLYANGVLISTDSGRSWHTVNTGLPGLYVTNLGVFDTLLFADLDVSFDVTYNLYDRPIHEMTDTTKSAVKEPAPGMNTLTVYPNPLANTATIDYTLAEQGTVSILIYDALGRSISSPVLNTDEGAGEHTITFDAHDLPSGMYWCHLTDGNVERVAKLVIQH